VSGVALDARGLWVHAGGRAIVADAKFAGRAGELVAVIGPSGSGKSTFLRALCGRLAAGLTARAEVLAWTLAGGPAGSPLLGRVVTHLPQEAGVALDPYRTIGAQLRAVGAARPEVALGLVGFDGPTAARVAVGRPHVLSGGMAERAALALALARGSPALFCDEPTTGLDHPSRRVVLGALRAHADQGRLVVVVTHDRPAVTRHADRVLRFSDGHLEVA
jgi:ABC-type multidrug transport system ATPase subunit